MKTTTNVILFVLFVFVLLCSVVMYFGKISPNNKKIEQLSLIVEEHQKCDSICESTVKAEAENAVKAYVAAEQRKKNVADSTRVAMGFSELVLDDIPMLSLEKTRTSDIRDINAIYSSLIFWNIGYALGLSYEEEKLIKMKFKYESAFMMNILNKNITAIKNILLVTNKIDIARDFFQRELYWLDKKNPAMEKQFESFFLKYGNLNAFPYSGSKDSIDVLFWNDMNKIMSTDKAFFDQPDPAYAPERYAEWLMVKRWRTRLGEETTRKYVEVVRKILYD